MKKTKNSMAADIIAHGMYCGDCDAGCEECIPACQRLASDIESALDSADRRNKREIERLRAALAEIRDHWACQYDHPRKENEMYRGPYGIGVTDAHRVCADIARTALGAK